MRIPLVILAGSDLHPSRLPEAGAEHHPLALHKGVELTLGGEPLLARVIERWRQVPEMGPIWVAGPAARHQGVGADELIDTDGTLAVNVHAAVNRACRLGRQGPLAFATCDVLPDLEELEEARADLRRHPRCALWYPMVRAPRSPGQLGAFGWKPRYAIAPAPGAPPTPVLPGHWIVIDPIPLRMALAEDIIGIAYRTRNRAVSSRRVSMMITEIGRLLWQDLRHIAALRLPLLTSSVFAAGIRITKRLQAGTLDTEYLAQEARKMLVKRRFQHRSPPPQLRFPIVDAPSLARDVDTREEAEQLEKEWRAGRA